MAGQNFTEEEIRMAKETSLTELAAHYGYHPRRVGTLCSPFRNMILSGFIMTGHGTAGQGLEMEKRAGDHRLIF